MFYNISPWSIFSTDSEFDAKESFFKQVRLESGLNSLLGNHHLLEISGLFYSFVIFFIKHYYKYRTGRQKIVTQKSVERTIVKRKKRQVLEKLPDG